jgi:hypothetical protein
MNDKTKQILLTNDDSIHSPGLWAAAEALDSLALCMWLRREINKRGWDMPCPSIPQALLKK